MVFKSKSGSNLFNAEALKAICHLEDTFTTPSFWTSRCRYPSVAFYTANLQNKKCSQLTDEDITAVSKQLQECGQYYIDGTMQCLSNTTKCTLPDLCENGGHIHQMFYYLADRGFAETAKRGKPFLKYAQLDLVTVRYGLNFFTDDVDGQNIQEGDVTFCAGYFGSNAKFNLFTDYMIDDARFFILAMGLVLVIMLIYLRSPTLMVATVLNVIFSFAIAYFLYFFVLRMQFYPFVNVLGALLLIAVGADDVFIFNDMWEQSKLEQPNGNHALWMSQAFYHAALSVTVTSLTTGAAFFSNLVSQITAIRCFGLFAGLGIMANLLLMLTWTPAVIVSIDRVTEYCCKSPPSFYTTVIRYIRQWTQKTDRVYGNWFPNIIEKGRFLWLVLLFLLGVGGLVVIFYKPGLKLPTSSEFQVFPDWHPMEVWDKGLKLEFQSQLDKERKEKGSIDPMYSWGLRNKDNGDWLDPNNSGILEFDKNFSPLKPESQVALLNFCHAAKNQTFTKPTAYKCFFDEVLEIGNEICSHPLIKFNRFASCCDNFVFPFSEDLINDCILPAIVLGEQNTSKQYMYRLANSLDAPVFNKSNKIVAMMMRTSSKFDYDANFENMDKAYRTIHKFYEGQKALMPDGMKSMCFSGRTYQFRFYDLQRSISTGTYSSIALSLAVAAIVMLLTSRNVIITLYAIATILLAIAVTVGTIVLMGWELGILESIAISLSVGLSIDFTIHYGVAYRVSKGACPKERVQESFHRVGWAVSVAALTTFLAGASVIPSRILAYSKLGIFLMLVMSFSWIYATFFFQSLCRVIGPRGNFCQIPSPLKFCCKNKKGEHHVAAQELESTYSNYSDEALFVNYAY